MQKNNSKGLDSELIFVIESCQNCKQHGWNTRHDEQKYLDFFNKGKPPFPVISSVSAAIVEKIPNALTMRNQIPKAYLPYDLYCNLIPNADPNTSYFQQVPRTGAFEVSFKGLVSKDFVLGYSRLSTP